MALRPLLPKAAVRRPNSVRLLDPMMPIGADRLRRCRSQRQSNHAGLTTTVNFGWEYVWHCHILSHEEMDMMRPIILAVLNLSPPSRNQCLSVGEPDS